MQQKNKTVLSIAIVVIIAASTYFVSTKKAAPSVPASGMDAFAQCLKDKGATFYGASWCPHCQNQKKLLNESKNLPYVECATPDGKDQTKICTDNKIEGYPTWVFADGSRQSGELSLNTLSQKTSCTLPQ